MAERERKREGLWAAGGEYLMRWGRDTYTRACRVKIKGVFLLLLPLRLSLRDVLLFILLLFFLAPVSFVSSSSLKNKTTWSKLFLLVSLPYMYVCINLLGHSGEAGRQERKKGISYTSPPHPEENFIYRTLAREIPHDAIQRVTQSPPSWSL